MVQLACDQAADLEAVPRAVFLRQLEQSGPDVYVHVAATLNRQETSAILEELPN